MEPLAIFTAIAQSRRVFRSLDLFVVPREISDQRRVSLQPRFNFIVSNASLGLDITESEDQQIG